MDSRNSPPGLRFGSVTLIPDERLVLKDGQPVPFSPKAFDLLVVLASSPGRLLTKDQLMQAVWPDTVVEESNLTYHVFAIRKALGDAAGSGELIETVPKRGYRFTGTVTRMDAGHEKPAVPAVAAEPPAAGSSRVVPGQRRIAAVWFAAGIVFAGGIAFVTTRPAAPAAPPIQAQISPGVDLTTASPFALSPDGQQLVFAGKASDGVSRLWIRRMDEETAHPLAGTETALGGLTPPMFWSPDSLSVAFDGAGWLKRIDVKGGAPRTVCDIPSLAIGGSWNAANVVIIGQPSGGLIKCPAAGGPAEEVTRLDPARGESAHVFPSFLPDGRHFLYLSVSRQTPEKSGVFLGSLDAPPGASRPDRLLATGFSATYVRVEGASTGHVVFLQDGTLFAQEFDERALELRGQPAFLARPVGTFLDGGHFSVSQTDVIAFRTPQESRLTWFDRSGNKVGGVGDAGFYSSVAMSPDGSRIATAKEVSRPNIDQDLWTLDLTRATLARVTSAPELEESPVWLPDGKRLIFTTTGGKGALSEQATQGESSSKLILRTNEHLIPTSVSGDGRFLLYTVVNAGATRLDIWAMPLADPGKRFPLIQRDFDQGQARFSPDGKHLAYVSNESGRNEVLVRRFDVPSDGATSNAESVVVSSGGGTAPRWRADGGELYFISADGTVNVAEVHTSRGFSVGVPRALFQVSQSHGDWAVAVDGSRFLIALPAGPDMSAPFTILWNRLARLGTRTP